MILIINEELKLKKKHTIQIVYKEISTILTQHYCL